MTSKQLTWLGALLALPACYESHEVLDGEEYTCSCSYERLVPIASGMCSTVSSMGCSAGATIGSITTTSTITACSTVRDPDETGTIAHGICLTACNSAA